MVLKIKSKWQEVRSVFTDTVRLMRSVNGIVSGIDRTLVLWMWVSAAWRGVATLGGFAIFGILLDRGLKYYLGTRAITPFMVLAATLIVLGYVLARSAMNRVRSWREEVFGALLQQSLDDRRLAKVQGLDLGRLLDPEFSQKMEKSETRGEDAIVELWKGQMNIFGAVVGTVASTFLVMAMSPVLILLMLLPVIPHMVHSARVSRERREMWESQHILRRKKHEYAWCLSGRGVVAHMRFSRFTPFATRRYAENCGLLMSRLFAFLKRVRAKEGRMASLQAVVLALVFGYLGMELAAGSLDFTKFFMFIGALRTFNNSMNDLTFGMVTVRNHALDYEYYLDFMSTKPLIQEEGARDVLLAGAPRIEFSGVSFSYPSQQRLAVSNCSFVLEPGEKVAIVGPNGSGKSTVAKLMAKAYVPKDGRILVNGIPLTEILQDSWGEAMHCVMQGPKLADVLIAEAIAGTEIENLSWPRLQLAAQLAGADDFVKDLVHGYRTQIGESWPEGVGFSTGQEQRIILANSFYRLFDERVVLGIFDEPMAHCDMETRERFYRSIRDLQGKTVVAIAHDPLFLHYFERVLLMEHGELIGDLRSKEEILAYRGQIAALLAADI